MNLARAQKVMTYLTLFVALAALAASGAMSVFATALMPIALVASWFWEPGAAALERQRGFWNLVLVLFIGFTAWQVLAGAVPVLGPAVDLVLVLVVAKLFQRARARDYTQIYALTFLMIAVATVLDSSVHFALIFVLWLVFCAIGFSLNQIVQETEGSRTRPQSVQLPVRYLALLGAMSGVLVVLTAAFFVFLPRIGIGVGQPDAGPPTKMSGFASSIDLSDHGAIGLDETVVMRVETGRPVSSPYWRGIAFDRFDGTRWSISPTLRGRRGLPLESGNRFERYDTEDEKTRRQRIELEPLATDVLFGLPHIAAIEYPDIAFAGQEQSWLNVSVDRAGTLHHGFGRGRRIEYVAESIVGGGVGSRSFHEVRDSLRRTYMVLPPTRPRLQRLAQRLTANLETPAQKAEAIERYLMVNYDYTLELPERGNDPVDHFLFVDRRGHCEFFSTAMVLLLRAVGVPARNVNGFHGGDWNSVGGYYVVRRMHAHSWVEVWDDREGWVTFDPTPAVGLPRQRTAAERGGLGPLDAWIDHFQRLWRGWVLDFDIQTQLELFGADPDSEGRISPMEALLDGLTDNWWRWLAVLGWLALTGIILARYRRVWLTLVGSIAGGVALVLFAWPEPSPWALCVVTFVPLWLAWRLRLVRVPRIGDSREVGALGKVYERLLRTLEKREQGLEGLSRLGPEQLARRLEHMDPDRYAAAAALARRYARLRFGPRATARSDVRELKRELAAVRSGLRRGAA